MQKNKRSLLLAISLVAAFVLTFSVALVRPEKAQGIANSNQGVQSSGDGAEENEAEQERNLGEDSQINNQNENTVNKDSDDEEAEEVENENGEGKAIGKAKENKGQANAAEHRSAVATFVQSLEKVAGEEAGIGQQVRTIAQQQNESKEKVAGGIEAVEDRGKLKTFLIGADYKNLDELRSEMVKTKSQTEQLKRLAERADSEENRAELQMQVQILEQEQVKIQSFIDENESSFSLFGWAVKLFQ